MAIKLALEAPEDMTSSEDTEPVKVVRQVDGSSMGAPIEVINPLGTNVNFLSAVLLPLSRMLGMGVYSTPGIVLENVGSIGMAFVLWLVGSLVAFSMLGSTAINATVFAQYTMHALDIAVTSYHPICTRSSNLIETLIVCASSTPMSLKVMGILGFVKIGSMVFIILTGFAVLSGMTRVEDPVANLRDPFAGSVLSVNALVTGILKIDYTFLGWNHAVNFLAEVYSKQANSSGPISSEVNQSSINLIRRASYAALSLASIIFLFINLAYFAAVPKETLKHSGSLVGAMFCESVYGVESWVATLGQARIVRETTRQGVLPYPEFFSSTWPFGTPGGPILMQWALSVLVIVIPPAGDAFNFLINLHTYPFFLFAVLSALAVWILRARSPLPIPQTFRTWDGFIVIYVAKCILTLVMPWVPPNADPRPGDSKMWYATYCLVGVGIIFLSGVYYFAWMVALPRWGGYEI
ncbi:hypothetical protein FRB98_008361, partial [Tulasnella sp. 332]